MEPPNPIRPFRERDSFLLFAAFVVLAVGVVVFVGIAGLTFSERLMQFDQRALLAFRNPLDASDPIGSRTVEHYVRDLSALGGSFVLTLITMLAVLYLLIGRRLTTAAYVAITISLNAAANEFLKSVFERLRPEIMAADPATMSYAFPSGHAMSSAAVYLTISLLLSRSLAHRWQKTFVLTVALFLTLTIGLSRVYRGVHWPTDVLAGWTLGITWAIFCWLIYTYLEHLRTQVATPAERTK